ncbi:MAG: VWA domain-containing protein [Ilumatobacteraceae bacterium]
MSDGVFEAISPEVGEIDESALTEQMEADPDATLATLARMTGATDVRLRAEAKRLAARLFIDLARTNRADARGIGRIASIPYQPDGDLDLDTSADELLEARAVRRAVSPEALRVHAWTAPTTAWCLLVDRSGSMHGEPMATAAMSAAVVAARAERDYAVLSFGRDVIACTAMWEHHDTDEVIDRVLALRGHGTTDVAGVLVAARQQPVRRGHSDAPPSC